MCPFCEMGVFGPRWHRESQAYRCKLESLTQVRFTSSSSSRFHSGARSRRPQSSSSNSALLLRLAAVPNIIHLVTHINHKAVERMNRNLNFIRNLHVTKIQNSYGRCAQAWKDVEVDEACFDKTVHPWELSTQEAKDGVA